MRNKILKYKEYMIIKEEFIQFHHNDLVSIKITDEFGEHNLETNMIEIGCSVDRREIYYKFKVLNKNDEQYPEESEMIFPLEFDGKEFGFIIRFRNYNHSHTGYNMIEKHYQGLVNIISISSPN